MRIKNYVAHIVRNFVTVMLAVIIIFLGVQVLSCSNKDTDNNVKKFRTTILHQQAPLPIVNMVVNGQKTKYIVDTGSEMTIIDRKFYHKNHEAFDIDRRMLFSASTVNGVLTDSAYMATVMVDSTRAEVVIMDIEDLIHNTYVNTGLIITGIIGSDFLFDNNAVLDFGNKTFKLK